MRTRHDQIEVVANVIARVWRGKTRRDNAAQYLGHLNERVFPALRRIEGYLGARVLRREVSDHVEFLVLTHWDSREALVAFAGENPEVAVVEPEARALLVEFDGVAQHFEVAYDLVELPAIL